MYILCDVFFLFDTRPTTTLSHQAGFVRGYEALCDQQQVRLRKRPEFAELENIGVAEGLADSSIVLW